MKRTILSHEKELREVKKQYGNPRLTQIEEEIQEIKIETAVLVARKTWS